MQDVVDSRAGAACQLLSNHYKYRMNINGAFTMEMINPKANKAYDGETFHPRRHPPIQDPFFKEGFSWIRGHCYPLLRLKSAI